MKKHFFLFLLLVSSGLFSQEKDSIKTNPIIFMDVVVGATIRESKHDIEPLLSAAIYYQNKNNLFGFRLTELKEENILNRLLVFTPLFFIGNTQSREYAVLYGKRFIKNRFSYSFVGGYSYTQHASNPIDRVFDESYRGFPFEVNVRWFKSEKRSLMLFGLIPVTKPTGFGSSFGVKLFGNLSKQSYIGIGLVFGLGYYKNYNE